MTERLAAHADTTVIDILLVEDDDGDAFLVEEELALTDVPHRLTRARTLREATALLAPTTGCVLLDLQLPDATGLDGVQALRRLGGTAIVVLTGLDDVQQGVAALSAGAQDYLTKGSVDGPLLLRAVRYAIERRRSEAAAVALREAELSALENARMERGLLPRPIVNDARVHVVSAYRPGRRSAVLGGDFFDAIETADGALNLMIGDISGHSADEAALGASMRIAWRTLVLSGGDHDVLVTLDRLLGYERVNDDLFATVATFTVAPDRRSAGLRLAGHPAPFLFDGTATTQLAGKPGLPIGLGLGGSWPVTEIALPPAWALTLFTDGLYEGRSGPSTTERLGEDGLAALIREVDWSPAERTRLQDSLLQLIGQVEERNGGPLSDDVATLLVRHG